MAKLPAQASASLQSALDQLNAYNQFYQGLQSYTAGVAALKEGSQSALDGSKQLQQELLLLKVEVNILQMQVVIKTSKSTTC